MLTTMMKSPMTNGLSSTMERETKRSPKELFSCSGDHPRPRTMEPLRTNYYAVYRSTSPRFSLDNPGFLLARTTATDLADPNTDTGSTYYYAVTAFDKGNNESRPASLRVHR